MNKENEILVSICSITYNHISFIRQCLDGFIMQKTNFQFEIIIHDDCSTDGTTDIVREYAEKYPNLIVPIYQSVNQHQLGNTSIFKTFVYPKARGKYFALCEGDDYWIDPYKLQKQVDFMESNLDCTMICTRAKLFSVRKNKYIGEQYCRRSDGFLNPIDVINRTGLYIATCSIMYRSWIINNYPDYCVNCSVGDYPLQITAAMKGSVYYFDDVMCVYRIDNAMSWYGQQKFNSIDSARMKIVKGQVEMFEGFSSDYPKYAMVYNDKIAEHICRNMPNWRCPKEDFLAYKNVFLNKVEHFSYKWKLYYLICKFRFPMIRFIYEKIFQSNYKHLRKYYGGSYKRHMDSFVWRLMSNKK